MDGELEIIAMETMEILWKNENERKGKLPSLRRDCNSFDLSANEKDALHGKNVNALANVPEEHNHR